MESMTTAEIVNLVIGALVVVGGGSVGVKRYLLSGVGEKKTNGCIKSSQKTGGALHISEEGLVRIKSVEDELKSDFRRKENQDIVCNGVIADLKLYIKNEMDLNAEKIIAAVKE